MKNKRAKKPVKNVNALAAIYQASASKKHELSMSFSIEDTNDEFSKWHESNPNNEGNTPIDLAYQQYSGDLIICLRNKLLKPIQEWDLYVESYCYSDEKNDVITIPINLKSPPMSFEEYQFGSTQKIDRGCGLKTRWNGAHKEMNKVLLEKMPDGYCHVRGNAVLSVTAQFKGADDYMYFKQSKMMRERGVSI